MIGNVEGVLSTSQTHFLNIQYFHCLNITEVAISLEVSLVSSHDSCLKELI